MQLIRPSTIQSLKPFSDGRSGYAWEIRAVKRRSGDAEVLGHILGRYAAGQQLLGRLDLAVGHLRLAATFAAELLGDFQPGL